MGTQTPGRDNRYGAPVDGGVLRSDGRTKPLRPWSGYLSLSKLATGLPTSRKSHHVHGYDNPCFGGTAGMAGTEIDRFYEPSIGDLLNIQVTSVWETEQTLLRTASGGCLLARVDICRSCATNNPDEVRMVPGTNVPQMNVDTWSTRARGSNEQFSNELLVLVDGPLSTPRPERGFSCDPRHSVLPALERRHLGELGWLESREGPLGEIRRFDWQRENYTRQAPRQAELSWQSQFRGDEFCTLP